MNVGRDMEHYGVRDALREQRLERRELGAFPLATQCSSPPRSITDGHADAGALTFIPVGPS